ncbi:MAG: pentapeptide repeat-containing protein [Nocardioides sp.]
MSERLSLLEVVLRNSADVSKDPDSFALAPLDGMLLGPNGFDLLQQSLPLELTASSASAISACGLGLRSLALVEKRGGVGVCHSFVDGWILIRRFGAGMDLGDADLRGARLEGASLSGACLVSANLSGCHLEGADLSQADLTGSDLSGSSLRRANLAGANLTQADMRRVDLRHSELKGAVCTGTALRGSDFWSAYVWDVSFDDAFTDGADIDRADHRGVTGPKSKNARV